jgi:tetratricopeptide (TPR) repeat protein
LALQQQLAEEYPDVAEYSSDAALTHMNLGDRFYEQGQAKEAEDEYLAALALLKRLSQEYPSVPSFRAQLAKCHQTRGKLSMARRREKEAESELRAGLSLFQRLTDENSTKPEYRKGVAATLLQLGALFEQTNRASDQMEQIRRSVAIYQGLTSDYPLVPEYRQELARIRSNLGVAHKNAGRLEAAEVEHRAALTLRKRLADDYPRVIQHQRDLSLSHYGLGAVLFDAHRPTDAAEEYRGAQVLLERLVTEDSANWDYHNRLAATLGAQAEIALASKNFVEARRLLEEALPHHRAALKAMPLDRACRGFFRFSIDMLAEVHLAQGGHAEASAAADQLAEHAFEPAKDRYKAACVLAGCIHLAESDSKLPEAQRHQLVNDYAGRAIATLRRAIVDGYQNAAQTRKEPALDPLRCRDDFKKLLADLEKAPDQPKQTPAANERLNQQSPGETTKDTKKE